jgi:hypothetical protein
MAALGVLAIVVAILAFGDGPIRPTSSSAVSPSPSEAAGGSVATSPTPASSATPAPSDVTARVASWTAVSPAAPGPDPRWGHSWTVDPSNAVAYLFGGRGSSDLFGDVWAYDLSADRWSELQPDGDRPVPRFEHGAAWIDELGLVVFGGRTEAGPLDDFWAFDPSVNAWRVLEATGTAPAPRAAACLALRADGRLWMYGGEGASGAPLAELWTYDPGPSSWSERTPSGGPPARSGSACWWTSDDRLVVHSGLMPGPPSVALGDLWVFHPDEAGGTWHEAGDFPPRERAAWTTTSRGGVVAGGTGAGGEPLSDVVVFDDRSLAATVLQPAPDGPPARSGGALADDPEGERTLLYGGRGADGPLGDLWALDLR